jgi:recombinational DNA repair ATPase RecF
VNTPVEQYAAALEPLERRYGRSLFGAHLDDVTVEFASKKSKLYASRGQQKLIVFLLKAALLTHVTGNGRPCVFLLDDFMTDFDEQRAIQLVTLLKTLPAQIIFTAPLDRGLGELLKIHMPGFLKLTI